MWPFCFILRCFDSRRASNERAHEEEEWFHGLLPREDTNRLLTRDGDYLLRVSEPEPGMGPKIILSARWKDKYHHFVVNEKD
ncbi:SH2 domain protein, partial [Teladorsagia circumcincta]